MRDGRGRGREGGRRRGLGRGLICRSDRVCNLVVSVQGGRENDDAVAVAVTYDVVGADVSPHGFY